MVAKSRFGAVGTAGKPGNSADSGSENRGDYFVQTITFTPTIVASTAAQATGKILPTGAKVIDTTINVFTAEATGLTKTLSVGNSGAATSIINAASVAATGMVDGGTIGTPVQSGNEITYSLGSADWAEFDGEVVIRYLGSEV